MWYDSLIDVAKVATMGTPIGLAVTALDAVVDGSNAAEESGRELSTQDKILMGIVRGYASKEDSAVDPKMVEVLEIMLSK